MICWVQFQHGLVQQNFPYFTKMIIWRASYFKLTNNTHWFLLCANCEADNYILQKTGGMHILGMKINRIENILINCLFCTLNIKSDYCHIPDLNFIVVMHFADSWSHNLFSWDVRHSYICGQDLFVMNVSQQFANLESHHIFPVCLPWVIELPPTQLSLHLPSRHECLPAETVINYCWRGNSFLPSCIQNVEKCQ